VVQAKFANLESLFLMRLVMIRDFGAEFVSRFIFPDRVVLSCFWRKFVFIVKSAQFSVVVSERKS